MEITLSNGWTLNVPDDYRKQPLDILNKWVEALRSVKYKQGRDLLRSADNTYCCLGVLCDIEGAEWVNRDNRFEAFGMYSIYTGRHNVMPDGNIWPCRVKTPETIYTSLASLNDAGLGFNDIATVLEHVYVQTT